MASTNRYRRGFRAAIDAYKASRANRDLREKSSIPSGKRAIATGNSKVPWRPAARWVTSAERMAIQQEKARGKGQANERDLPATPIPSKGKKKQRKKIRHETAVEKARRTAVRAHFAACKAARADLVRQAHRAAVDAYIDDVDLDPLGKESTEVNAIEDAQSAAEELISAYQSTVLWYGNDKEWQEALELLPRYAADAHFYAKCASEALEIAQKAADDRIMRAKFAKVCSTLATERAEHASERAVESAKEAYLAAYEYARLRTKKGPRRERKMARGQMRYAAKRIQILSFNKSQNLRDASEQNRLRNISFSRWPFRLSFGLFKLSNFLWECVFLLIGFVIDAARGKRFAKEEWKANRRAFAAAEAHVEKETGGPSRGLARATSSEFAFKYGAIDALIPAAELAAEKEADAAESISDDAKNAADTAQYFAAYCRVFVDFAEYCAARADLHEARHSVDSSGKVIAPAALRDPRGDARSSESIPRRAWKLLLRARENAAKSLERATQVAERASHQSSVTGYGSRPAYEVRSHIHWVEKLAKESASPGTHALFADVRRRSERADLAGCSYYAACSVSFLSRAGACAEDAVFAKGKRQLRSKTEDALSLCQEAISRSEWAAKKAAELQAKLSVPDCAAAKAAGFRGEFPRLTEYAQEAMERAQLVKEALESVLELNGSNVSIREVRAKGNEAAEIAFGAALLEHKARLEALSSLVSLHREAILESVASQRARKQAFVERLNGYIRVAEHAETEGARIFKAAGLDYRVKDGLVERARQLKEEAAEHSDDGYFGTPWRDKFRQGTVPEQLARVVDHYNTRRKQHEAEGEKETGAAIQGSVSQTKGCAGSLGVDLADLGEMINSLEERYRTDDFSRIASNARYLVRKANKYVREARDLSD